MKNDIIRKSGITADPELHQAETRAEHSRRRLEGSLNRLNETIQSKVSDTAGTVDMKVHNVVDRVRDRLDTSAERIDHFIEQGQQVLDERLVQVDRFVQELGPQIDTSLQQVRGVVGRLQGSLSGTVQKMDQVIHRIEGSVAGLRNEFTRSSDEVIVRAEGVARRAQTRFQEGISEVVRMIDLADNLLNELNDPLKIVNRNPRVLVPALFIGGLVIGLFFRGLFEQRRDSGIPRVTGGEPVRPIQGIPDTGVLPPNEGSRRVA